MTATDQLHSVLVHEERPRGSTFLELPTQYGMLRLDHLGGSPDDLVAATSKPVPPEVEQVVGSTLATANAGGDLHACIVTMRDVAGQHPMVSGFHDILRWLHIRTGNPQEALYCARQAVAVEQSPRRLASLGTVLAMLGRHDQALVVFDHLWSQRDKPEVGAAARTDLIQDYLHILLLTENWPRLRQIAGEIVAADPEHVGAGFHLALANHRLGQSADADAALRVIEHKVFPDHPLAAQIARLRQEIGSAAPATGPEHGDHLGTVDGLDDEGVLAYTKHLADTGDLDAATTVAQHLVARQAGTPLLNYQLALLLQEHDRVPAAMSTIDGAFDRPDLPDRFVAVLLLLREALDRRLNGGDPTWGISPDGAPTSGYRLALHRAVAHTGPPRAQPVYGPNPQFGPVTLQVAAPHPDTVATAQPSRDQVDAFNAEVDQINARWSSGDIAGAQAHAVDLARRYPYQWQSHNLAANLSLATGDNELARYEAKQAVSIAPTYQTLEVLGRCLRRAEALRDALLLLDHLWINRRHADSPDAVHRVLEAYLATLDQLAVHDCVMPVCREAIMEDPAFSPPWYHLGISQLNTGDPGGARSTLDQVLPHLRPDDPLASELHRLSTAVDQALAR